MAGQVITLLGGRVKLHEARDVYTPSSDAVWVASAVEALPQQTIFEPGFGTGAVGLCLLERLPTLSLIGMELQAPFLRQAHRNVTLNNRGRNVSLVQADVRHPPFFPTFKADHSLANPPFYTTERGFTKARAALATAHGLTQATLQDWLQTMHAHTAEGGTMTLINHTHNLIELEKFAADHRLKHDIIYLHTAAHRPAKRVIIRYHVGTHGIGTAYRVNAYDPLVSTAVLRQAQSIWTVTQPL